MYKEFWDLFVKDYGGLRIFVVICAVTVFVSFLEGLNVGLLVPLMETLEEPNGNDPHHITRAVTFVFDFLKIPWSLGALLLSVGFLMLFTSALKYVTRLLVARVQVKFGVWIKTTYMWNLLNADITEFHDQRLGALNATLTVQSDRSTATVMHITDFVVNLGMITSYLVAAFVIDPLLTAVALAMLLLVSLATQRYVKEAEKIGQTMVDTNQDFQIAALETLSGIHVVKAFLLERLRWLDFSDRTERVGQTTYNVTVNQGKMIAFHEITRFVLVGSLVYVGVSVLGLQLAVVGSLLFVLYRMAPRFAAMNMQRQGLAISMAALNDVRISIRDSGNPKIVSGEIPFESLKSGIELQDVGFSYKDSSQVLRNTTFTIESGKMTAVMGASGAGKTTIMDLIVRLYDPTAGRILIDGIDLKDLNLSSWRKSIGIVTQDIFLFNDTITNNISLHRSSATPDKIVDAAKRAYADDFIQQLPNGYQTIVGDRGWNLSGGQRQRIALARAILERPPILVLDEATSSLDSESEELIHQYIREIQGSCTMLVVAHRMSTVHGADKIVMLQDGAIVGEGNWETLLKTSDVFANYQRLQST